MKKLFYGSLLFVLLSGCSNNELIEKVNQQLDETNELVEQKEFDSALEKLEQLEQMLSEEKEEKLLGNVKKEIKRVKGFIAEEQNDNNQLAKVLIDLANKYGFVAENHDFHNLYGSFGLGIVYSQLIDFDHDGQSELYVLFQSDEYANETLSHRNEEGYIEEVWGVREDKPVLLRHDIYSYTDTSYGSDLTLSFITLKDGSVAIKHNHEKTGQGIHESINTYYTLTNSNFNTKEFSQSSGSTYENIPPEFYINNQAVSEENFHTELQKYDGEEQFIFKSSGGVKEFVIHLADSKNQAMEIIDQLTVKNNEAFTKSNSIKITPEIKSTIQAYRDFGNVDIRNKSYYQSMLLSLVINGFIEGDSYGQLPAYNGPAYSKKVLQSAMKKYYNIDIDPSSLGFSTDFSTNDLFVYKNDTLYLLVTDYYYGVENILIPEKVAQINDDLLYAKVQNSTFESDRFYNTYWESDIDIASLLDKPVNAWPDITKPFLKERLPIYLLLKKNGDEYQILYKGSFNLTDEDLKDFQ